MTESNVSEETKSALRENSLVMIHELQNNVSQLMDMYKQNPTFPADFYNLSLREADIRINTISDLYKRITGDELI